MADATYKVTELAAQARQIFGTTPEVVTVALKTTGKDTVTIQEAKKPVKDFLSKGEGKDGLFFHYC